MMSAVEKPIPSGMPTTFEIIRAARDVISQEAEELGKLAANVPVAFYDAVNEICRCHGSVIVSGIGKAGWIGQKISASFASTGTRSHYLHPSEAMHGDLGRIGPDDVVLVLSNSGETAEVLQLLPTFKKLDVPVISITAGVRSSLAQSSDIVLDYGAAQEACHLGLAPSTSTTMMLALGDALALVASQVKGFRQIDFAKFHPGGSLGRKLSTVDEIMRPIEACRVAADQQSVREIYVCLKSAVRRSGAILLTDERGILTGLFTDSDLARMLERGCEIQFDDPISEVMTRKPFTVVAGSKTGVAVEMLACHNISELPVVDRVGRPLGLIDITDVVSLLPRK